MITSPSPLALPYRCRHYPELRFLSPEGCDKRKRDGEAVLGDERKGPWLNGPRWEKCLECPGPEGPPDTETTNLERLEAFKTQLAEAATPAAPKEPQPMDDQKQEGEMEASKPQDSPAQPALCKQCGQRPQLVRRNGKGQGFCRECWSAKITAARAAKKLPAKSPEEAPAAPAVEPAGVLIAGHACRDERKTNLGDLLRGEAAALQECLKSVRDYEGQRAALIAAAHFAGMVSAAGAAGIIEGWEG